MARRPHETTSPTSEKNIRSRAQSTRRGKGPPFDASEEAFMATFSKVTAAEAERMLQRVGVLTRTGKLTSDFK